MTSLYNQQIPTNTRAQLTSQPQRGFSLLELLIVVGIMAIVAGSLIYSNRDNIVAQSKQSAVNSEMQSIRQALLRYKRDNFQFPPQKNPADFEFLFAQVDEVAEWNSDYQSGWRGPYLGGGDSGWVTIADYFDEDSGEDEDDYSPRGYRTLSKSSVAAKIDIVRGIPDAFAHWPTTFLHTGSTTTTRCDSNVIPVADCVLQWWSDVEKTDSYGRYGRPYLLFDANKPEARIVSMGADGLYQLDAVSDESDCVSRLTPTTSGSDDLVICLY